jgi:hypothetical protein
MPEHGELHFSRVFDAPRELVFASLDRFAAHLAGRAAA